jgi:hypothetical protein
MHNTTIKLFASAFLVPVACIGTTWHARVQAEKLAYPAAAPLSQYLMSDKTSEIALARSAAPESISDGAEVLVLERNGYTTAVKGRNGFVCLVERSFGAATDFQEFWNPKIREPYLCEPDRRKNLSANRSNECGLYRATRRKARERTSQARPFLRRMTPKTE